MEIRKFEQIDTLRFFAVLSVIISHWAFTGAFILRKVDTGARGVDLFFVISGFLITLGLLRSKDKAEKVTGSIVKFYARRFLRIFPIYYLTIFLIYLFDHPLIADSFWWNVTYLSNFYCIKKQSFGELGYLWSLAVEEQFYLVWPFVILLLPKRWLPYAILSAILLSLSAKSYWWVKDETFWISYMHPLGSLDALAIGSLLAYVYSYHRDWLRALVFNKYVVIFVFVEAFACMVSRYTPVFCIYHVGVRTFTGIFFAWLIARAAFGFEGRTGRILNNKALQYIGKISYAIYLFHSLVPLMYKSVTPVLNKNVLFILFALTTLALASVSWYFFESKILRLKERFE
jgi:peptidoglycan/LPS O-acetylase OafA/YrhL